MNINGVWITRAHLPQLLKLTGVHRTTAARWLDRRVLPLAIHKLLLVVWEGRLGEIHTQWSGFSIHPKTGNLVDPLGYETRPGDILAARLRRQYKAALEKENKELRAQLRLVTNQVEAETAWLEYCLFGREHEPRPPHTGTSGHRETAGAHHAWPATHAH